MPAEWRANSPRRPSVEKRWKRLVFASGNLEFVATCWSSPSVSTEQFHLYLTPYSLADRIGKGGGRADEFEEIIVREIALSELARLVDNCLLADAKSFLLVQTLRLRHPDLFDKRRSIATPPQRGIH